MTALLIFLAALSAVAPGTGGAAHKGLNGFPPEFVGRWGEDVGGCSPGAIHGGLTIRPKLIADGEFSGEVKSVVRKPDGSIDVVELWDIPESPAAKSLSNYSLSKNGKSLTVRTLEPGSEYLPEPLALVRCGAHR
jgi:hypothetical protein